MKVRILGTLFVFAVLAAMAVMLPESESGPTPNQPTAPSNDTGLQPLKIN